MSAEENKALFRRFMDELANKGNLGIVDELVAPDFVEHEPLPPAAPSSASASPRRWRSRTSSRHSQAFSSRNRATSSLGGPWAARHLR